MVKVKVRAWVRGFRDVAMLPHGTAENDGFENVPEVAVSLSQAIVTHSEAWKMNAAHSV